MACFPGVGCFLWGSFACMQECTALPLPLTLPCPAFRYGCSWGLARVCTFATHSTASRTAPSREHLAGTCRGQARGKQGASARQQGVPRMPRRWEKARARLRGRAHGRRARRAQRTLEPWPGKGLRAPVPGRREGAPRGRALHRRPGPRPSPRAAPRAGKWRTPVLCLLTSSSPSPWARSVDRCITDSLPPSLTVITLSLTVFAHKHMLSPCCHSLTAGRAWTQAGWGCLRLPWVLNLPSS